MAKLARIESFLDKALLAGTAVLTISLGGISYAQDGQKSANITMNKVTWAGQSGAGLATNFDERWRGSDKEFVLGTDGVVKQGKDARGSPQKSSSLNNIGSGVSSLALSDETVTNDAEMSLPTGSVNQIGAILRNNDDTMDVHECGAPPLSPDEIKALVVQTARNYGVDEVFATAIAWAESGFDQSRNSPKGARGPMQLIPATAARFGVTDICDPAQNIEGGMKYLRVLVDEFQNPLLVAAAYNSGEQRIYEHGGIPPFKETVGYVAKVVNYQLGLPTPSAKDKARTAAPRAVPDARASGDAGVITVKKTGTFVGGVMHF